MTPPTIGTIMARPVKPAGARKINLNLNPRLKTYLAAGQSILSKTDLGDRRGQNSKIIRAAVERLAVALARGDQMPAERLRVYCLEYLDAVYLTRSRVSYVYLDEETVERLDAIASALAAFDPPPLLQRTYRGVNVRGVLMIIAICWLADELGKHKPLAPEDC